MKRNKWLGVAVGACTAAMLATSVSATTLQKLSLDDVVASSATVVVGEAISARTERTDNGVFTHTTFRVNDAVVGAAGAEVVVTTLGGRFTSGKYQLSENWPGSPQFSGGDRVMLFLQESRVGDMEVVGFNQGVLRIVSTASGDAVRSPDGGVQSLDTMKAQVRALRSQGHPSVSGQ